MQQKDVDLKRGLILFLKAECNRGIFVTDQIDDMIALMFADYVAFFDDTIIRLQHQINCIHSFCESVGMSLNLLKTKIIVFRKDGILKRMKRNGIGQPIDIVPFYKYLVVYFTPKLILTKTKGVLAHHRPWHIKALIWVPVIRHLYKSNPVFNTLRHISDSKRVPSTLSMSKEICSILMLTNISFTKSNMDFLNVCAIFIAPNCRSLAKYWLYNRIKQFKQIIRSKISKVPLVLKILQIALNVSKLRINFYNIIADLKGPKDKYNLHYGRCTG